MLIVWLSQVLFGAAAVAFCGATCHAVLRRDRRAGLLLTVAGSLALIFFVTVPRIAPEMAGVAVVAILAGMLLSPAAEPAVALDSTATRKSRR